MVLGTDGSGQGWDMRNETGAVLWVGRLLCWDLALELRGSSQGSDFWSRFRWEQDSALTLGEEVRGPGSNCWEDGRKWQNWAKCGEKAAEGPRAKGGQWGWKEKGGKRKSNTQGVRAGAPGRCAAAAESIC